MNYKALSEGKELSWLPSYGPEMRGGTASCSVTISDESVGSPIIDNVADVKSLAIHPYTTTHSQMSPEELEAQHITPATIRLSIGVEHIDDIIADLERGFAD